MTTQLARTAQSSLLAALLTVAAMTAQASANADVYRQALPSTTYILASDGSGSGVLVDRDQRLVLTNAHVVGRDRHVQVLFPHLDGTRVRMDREYYMDHLRELAIDGEVLSVDQDRDLALVQLASVPEHATAVTLGEPAMPGEDVHALGNPGASDALWCYTPGCVRANYFKTFRTSMSHHMQVLELNAAINPGDSGGPIVNDRGQLVAISQSFLVEGRLISYGVDISEIRAFLEAPHDNPRSDRSDSNRNQTGKKNTLRGSR